MKKVALVLFLFIINSISVYAHGFGAHAAHYSEILALNEQYHDLIIDARYRPYFIYGSIFPDMQYSSNFKATLEDLYQKMEEIDGVNGLTYEISTNEIPDVETTPYPFGIDTHDDNYGMAFAEYLLTQCAGVLPPGPNPGSDGVSEDYDARYMKLAFALGYYAHLASDVAAHDFMVPKITAAFNLGDIQLITNNQTFASEPNSQTEGIIEALVDYYYGDNSTIADVVFNHVWVRRSQYEPTITQMDFNTGYSHLFYGGPDPTYYDAPNFPELNPVLLFFHEVLTDWFSNNPMNLPSAGELSYRKSGSAISANGFSQLATVFRFVNRFYPAVAGHPFNGKNRLDEVLADWITNHLDIKSGWDLLLVRLDLTTALTGGLIDFRAWLFDGYVYPTALAETNMGMISDVRSLVSLMLADIEEADRLVARYPEKVNLTEYNKLKNSDLFSNNLSVLEPYWNEYRHLGAIIYKEVGPPNKWYSDWSAWHANSMAWGALSSINNLIPEIYQTNQNVAVYDAYFEVDGQRITEPQSPSFFSGATSSKVVMELYCTSDVPNQSLTLRVKKDHSSTNYNSDVIVSSTTFNLDQNPLQYNTVSRKTVELPFSINYSSLYGYDGYYFELVQNSNGKVIFTSSVEQYQERLNLSSNYSNLYSTYSADKWPVSLGLLKQTAVVNLTNSPIAEGNITGEYKINGIVQNTLSGYLDEYVTIEAVAPSEYSFFKWSDGSTSNPRILRLSNPTNSLYAVYKGTQVSDNQNAFEYTSQRNVIKLLSNRYMSVYESMQRIWVEKSTDGVNWQIVNGGQPLCDVNSKQPSFDVAGTTLYISYQQESVNGYSIKLAEYNTATDEVVAISNLFETYDGDYNFDAQPTIAIAGNDITQHLLTLWRVEERDGFNYEPGIYNIRGYRSTPFDPITWTSFDKLPNTGALSLNASVVGHTNNSVDAFHVIWENDEAIYYQYADIPPINNPLNWNWFSEVSLNCGLPENRRPEMVVMNVDNLPRVVWVGERDGIIDDPTKVSALYAEKALVLRGMQQKYENGQLVRYWNPQVWKFGSNVTEAAIERSTNDGYLIAWSEGETKKFIMNSSWTIRNMGITGKGTELMAAPTVGEMKASTIYSSGQVGSPNHILSSGTIDEIIPKENIMITSAGREGIVSKAGVEIYFALADIFVDGEMIEFVDVETNTIINSKNDLNRFLVTKPFSISESSTISLSLMYNSKNHEQMSDIFEENQFVNFKVEMVDTKTDEIIGVYDNVTFNKVNTENHKLVSYEIDPEGISAENVKLRLVVNDNLDATYTLSHLFNEERVISKRGVEAISFQGELVVDEYSLAQNYPNPFNPVTNIVYAIPEAGNVELIIYDILGRQVTKLVNQFQQRGKYTISFDAASFASGVYLYSIKVNDFSQVKKMVLLK